MAYGYFLSTCASVGGGFDEGLLRRRKELSCFSAMFIDIVDTEKLQRGGIGETKQTRSAHAAEFYRRRGVRQILTIATLSYPFLFTKLFLQR